MYYYNHSDNEMRNAKMNIVDFDYDTTQGFVWILVESKNADTLWSVQCCLADRSDKDAAADKEFELKIDAKDCGHNDGLCGDANTQAFKHYGENRCMTALFNKAKEAGFEVISL